MKPGHAVSLIEAAYQLDTSTERWLERVATAASVAFDSNQGAMAFRYDASDGHWVQLGRLALNGLSPDFARDFFSQGDMAPEVAMEMAREFLSMRFDSVKVFSERLGHMKFAHVLTRHGIDDMMGANGSDPSGRGCMVMVAVNKSRYAPKTSHLWHRLAAHISAGNRLRTTLETVAQGVLDPVQHAEAVLTPNGKVDHATGPAESRSAREALREALVRIDAARAERKEARRSVDLWRGLVAGRWSLVEHFERDGRRYYLAHKNDPELKQDRALTLRERQVLGYAELGNSNKVTAYALGISSSTVSTLLTRAKKKLGTST